MPDQSATINQSKNYIFADMLNFGSRFSRSVSTGRARSVFGFVVAPQKSALLVERFGRYKRTLEPGLNWIVPFVDKIAYRHSLKEEAVSIPNQTAITQDNVTISIDGVLYMQVEDPFAASYGIGDAVYALIQLAQTTMRSEIGKLSLDKTFAERDTLNQAIVSAINSAAGPWGVSCLRYEIRDITPPAAIRSAMEMQAEAERRKRAEVLQSEGQRQSEINTAEGRKQAAILEAAGQAESIRLKAEATAQGLKVVSETLSKEGRDAAALRVAEQWISAWEKIAKESSTVIVPSNPADAAGMVAQGLAIFQKLSSNSQESIGKEPGRSNDTKKPQSLDDII
jgi:regulator of protease activity HflC (stomatin/prohibitin superfamily)